MRGYRLIKLLILCDSNLEFSLLFYMILNMLFTVLLEGPTHNIRMKQVIDLSTVKRSKWNWQ